MYYTFQDNEESAFLEVLALILKPSEKETPLNISHEDRPLTWENL